MPTFNNVLFAVDFSDRSRAVQPFVQAMASTYNARVTLMHVVQLPTDTYGVQAAWPVLFDLTAMQEEAQQKLKGSFESPAPPLRIETIAEPGDPAIYITSYSEGGLALRRNRLIPGHQIVSEVVDGATKALPFGMRVGVSWLVSTPIT